MNIKDKFFRAKRLLLENTLDRVLCLVLVDLVPCTLTNFKDHAKAIFWIIHCTLLFYIYGVGSLEYQMHRAQDVGEFIKSFVNLTILNLTANATFWYLNKRSLLAVVLKQIKENDQLAKSNPAHEKKHKKIIGTIKYILIAFYAFNAFNQSFIYMRRRIDVNNDFCMTLCVGMQPQTKSPDHEICVILLFIMELNIMVVVLNFQAILLLLIAHTAAMFEILSEEMLLFNSPDVDNIHIKEQLTVMIGRHALTLDIVDKLKTLYSVPIGVDFGTNAVSICLFFYLPWKQWIGFIPVMGYCVLIFFLYCFLGQRLVNASEMFERSVYASGWENFDLREKKLILIMLMQAQFKVEILAADIVPVNISSFATTLQWMFKFITVVKI